MPDQSDIGQQSLTDQYVYQQYFGNIHTKNVPVSGENAPFVYDSYGNKSGLQVHKDHIVIDDFVFTQETLIDSLFPLGFVKMSTSSTPPNIPNTSWEQIAEGRLLVGAGSGVDSNDHTHTFELEANVGEYRHVLTVSEMASHTHDIDVQNQSYKYFVVWDSTGYVKRQEASKDGGGHYGYEGNGFYGGGLRNTGDDASHENTPPTVAYYMWKRVT